MHLPVFEKKKKLISLLLVIVMVLGMLPSSAFAEEALPDEHVHSWGDWIATSDSTCTEAGSMIRTCACGESETSVIPAKGHAWPEWTVITPAACTEDGLQTRTCSACGETETTAIQALGHNWNDGEITAEADCENPGARILTCMTCGAVDTVVVPAKGHSWSEWSVIIPATCTEAGERTRSCGSCGTVETEVISALGHTWGAEENVIESDCVNSGSYTHTCSVCNVTETVEVPANGHEWTDWELVAASTCSVPGTQTRTCKVCKSSETEDLTLAEHEWGEWAVTTEPTCTEEGVQTRTCTVCETAETGTVPANGHKWDTEDEKEAATCTVCDEKRESTYVYDISCAGDKWRMAGNAYLVETPEFWAGMFRDTVYTGDWAKDLLTVAASQIGYHGESDNYIKNKAGVVRYYSRYGDWFGDSCEYIYGDWCAMFVSFCLNYAHVSKEAVPLEASCVRWINALKERGLFTDEEDYVPSPGDLIFFDYPDPYNFMQPDGRSDHTGIVLSVDEENAIVTTIEGAVDNTVGTHSYELSDRSIMGYCMLPENPALKLENTEEEGSGEEEILSNTIEATDESTYAISVTYRNTAGIPMTGTALVVSEILPGTEEYQNYLKQSAETIGTTEASIGFARVFDINIVDSEDPSIVYEPADSVDVQIKLFDAAPVQAENMDVVHFEGDDTASICESSAGRADGTTLDFSTESFSVYVVAGYTIEKVISAEDGHTYKMTVTYGEEAQLPDDAALEVAELNGEEYEDYLSRTATLMEAASFEYARIFDISIVNAQGGHLEPAAPVEVKIELIDAENSEEDFSVVHFSGEPVEMEAETEGNTVTFTTEGFSVYAIVAAPEPYVPTVQDLLDLEERWNDPLGFYLSYTNSNGSYYFTNSLNSNGAFIETQSIDSASPWYFTPAGGTDQYYVYTKVNGVVKYISNRSGNNNVNAELTEDVNAAVKFDLSNPATAKFLFKKSGEDKWLQHSGSGSGIRFYKNATNTTNSYITITYVSSVLVSDDYYGLNGKTYSVAYYEESVKGAGLTDQQSGSKLTAAELLVRPDVLNNSGELLISKDSDLTDWTFTWIEGTAYYITTQVGGTTKYLTLGSNSISLLDEPTANSRITVESGTGAFAGKYKFSNGNYALTLSGGKAENGFVSSRTGGDYVWLSLVTKSPLLDDDDFIVYSAEKADLSNSEQVPNGAEVIVYTRVWNESTKKYEFYAINSDGSLIRCFESGDMIQWLGSTINTAIWQFTEYYVDPDADPLVPNYYYELQNTYNNQCIRPVNTGEFLRSVSEYPDYFDRSINLNGRRYGYYYSTILAWDDDSYGYIGLKVKDDMSGIEICPMSEADTFFFAIMKPVEQAPEPTSVATVDHEAYGITVKIQDYKTPGKFNGQDTSKEQNDVLGTIAYQPGDYVPKLLSTNLDETTGYPTVVKNGQSLGNLYNEATEVNHLFIENTYYSSGYYEFDSTQNFASFYKENGEYDPYNFTVYEELGTNDLKSTASMQHGQFFPYNKLSNEYATNKNMYDANGNELPDSNPRKGEKLRQVVDNDGNQITNYYFGVEIEASFTQTVSGLDAWGHDIIYEFTGDDDFWLYVDGELIIDLGGIHSAMAASVNYKTGYVTVNGESKTLRQIFEENYRGRHQDASEEDVARYLAEYFNEGEIIFKDYSTHTMRIFYMERGAGASNLHMRFNLASVKPGTVELSKQISGVDSTESFMAEYPFQIFFKTQDDETEQPLVPGSNDITVKYKDTTRDVTYCPTFTGANSQKTYTDVFLLKPGETAVISFPDDAYTYRIVECFVNTGVYKKVLINGDEVDTIVPDGQSAPDEGHYIHEVTDTDDRIDVSSSYAKVDARGRMIFTNQVDPNAKGTLVFVKHLYAEDGTTPIPHAASDTTFTFRLYLGTENTPDDQLPLADMYSYHVKDDNGNYCIWQGGGFVSLPGKNTWSALSDAEKLAATFTTSMNGTIANIPVDYTVEVREIPAGTKYKVEERDYELPDGYTLQWYVPYYEDPTGNLVRTDPEFWGKSPVSGLIANGLGAMIEIRNLKGWGLRAFKEWSDAEWMQARDPVYFAVYIDDGAGNPTLVADTVKQLAYGEESVYWFFEHLQSGIPFDRYVIREVTLSGTPEVDEKGHVTNAGSLTITPVDVNGVLQIDGTQIGETDPALYTYKLVSYTKGELPAGANVREDTICNKRQGLDLYLKDWAGHALAGGTFTMTDNNGNAAGQGTFTADENGLITIAYLREDENYTLHQIGAPTGYFGLQTALTISRNGSDITVTADASYNDWWELDDTDSTSGVNITYGTLTIKNKPVALQIKKTQRTAIGEPLEGVTFALYRQVMGNNGLPRKDYRPIAGFDSLVTDANGIVPQITAAFQNGSLLPGTYYLYETNPLDGYSPLSSDVIFTVSRTGTVTIESGSPSGVQHQIEETDTLTYTIAVPNQFFGTAELTVKKTVENGIAADEDGTNTFNYTAKLYLPDGLTPWNYSDDDFTNGTASFSLGHNATKVFTVPLNAVVTVVETANSAYTTHADLDETNAGETTTSTIEFNNESLMSTVHINDETGVTLTYTNTRRTVEITVKKKVVGNGGTFTFTVLSEDLKNKTLAEGITVDGDGSASFTLSPTTANLYTDQQKLTVPYGSELTITETADPLYQTSVQVGNASPGEGRVATITADKNLTVTFTNTGVIIAPTGLHSELKPFIWIAVVGSLAGLVTIGFRLRRRKEEEA